MNWKRYLPNTVFICPNGHEVCTINPVGFQWFDLTKDDPKYILQESLKAEKKLGKFIDEVKIEFNLENSNMKTLKKSEILNKLHIVTCLYLTFGWMLSDLSCKLLLFLTFFKAKIQHHYLK